MFIFRRLIWLGTLTVFGEAAIGGTEPASAPIAAGLTETARSPHAVVRSVGLNEVRWTDGFWGRWLETVRQQSLPALTGVMEGTERTQFLRNFQVAAGRAEGRHRGPDWNDGDCYKWLEAIAAVYAATNDRQLDEQMGAAIRDIAAAQRDDGYLHTPVLIRARQGDSTAVPFENPLNFEMYNFGHLMTAACVHHRATGRRELLEVAIRAADFLDRTFAQPSPALARHAICPSHYMGIIELYRTTRDMRYLELAGKWFALREKADSGDDDNQDRVPFRQQRRAVGHAVRANYLYAGAADLFAETGDRTLLEPLSSVWRNVVNQKMYITGACGALFDGASPDGSSQQKQISRVHQAYGREYQLPNSTAHNETCAAIGNVLWNWRMLQITGEARFADVMELALFNAALSGISLDGTRFFYTNTLRQLDQMPVDLRWSRRREPFISCFCCPPNLVRTLAEVGNYAYGKSDGAIWVHLYGGSELTTDLAPGQEIMLIQKTKYPWDGGIEIRVAGAPSAEWSMNLRIPGWCKRAGALVNGRPVAEKPEPGRYFSIRRLWSPGDIVQLHLEMSPRLLEAHSLVEEARNQVAIQRGPVVYCLESNDLTPGRSIMEVVIPQAIELKPRFDPRLLGGVTVLEGRAGAVPNRKRSQQLYDDLTRAPLQPIDITLIPYYAWANRGPSEMTVWLPLQR